MPVTARLSKAFYDRLGERVTNELVGWFNDVDATYRNDLKDLNELNFARFDAKVEQRFAHYDAKWETRFVEFEAKFDKRFVEFEAKFDKRLVEFEAKFDKRLVDLEAKVDKRLVDLESRLDKRFVDFEASIDQRFAALEAKLLTHMEQRFADQTRWMFGTLFAAWVTLMIPIITLLFKR